MKTKNIEKFKTNLKRMFCENLKLEKKKFEIFEGNKSEEIFAFQDELR